MFNLYNWNLYGKSAFDYLKNSNSTSETQLSSQEPSNESNKKYSKEELRELAKRDLTDEEIYQMFELEKNKTVKASQQEINQLRSDINLAKLEALQEGRRFGNYEGAYKAIYPNIGLLQQQRESDIKFRSKIDDTLLNLDNLKNISQINAKNYDELEDKIVEMSSNEDERVDKSFFNQQNSYAIYNEREEIILNNIEREKQNQDNLTLQIAKTEESISKYDNLINAVKNTENFKELTKKENELKENLDNIKLQISILEYDPYKLNKELDVLIVKEENIKKNSPIKAKKEGTPKKKSSSKNVTSVKKTKTTVKLPPNLQKIMKDQAEIGRQLEKSRPLTEEEKEINNELKELEKQKYNLSNEYINKKKIEEKKLNKLTNELNEININLSKYKNDYYENKKKGSGTTEKKGSGMMQEKKGSGMMEEKKGSGMMEEKKGSGN